MADQKITQLTELAEAPNDADLVAIVDDVAGTPVTKKLTIAHLHSGLAASGANSDITSLSGLTTDLSIAQGGTGASTASAATSNLGLGTEDSPTFAGLIVAGNIIMGDNSITGIDTLTFTDTVGTIAGIANGNLVDKTATQTFSGITTFENASPPFNINRTTSLTNVIRNVANFKHTTDTDMVNGFGAGFYFQIRDSAAANNNIGLLSFERDGADNAGKFKVWTGVNAGSVGLTIDASQVVDLTGTARVVGDPTTDGYFVIKIGGVSYKVPCLAV